MQLKYHDDIKWQDLPKIERPFFAQSTIKYELSRPWPRLQKGIFRDPLSDIYAWGRRHIDPDALKRLLRKVEEGSVLLVHTFAENVTYPAFIWKQDDNHPDKGQWTLSEHLYSASEYKFNLLLSTVKKPQQRGSIKAAAATTTPEYGYIPSSSSIANTLVKGLYNAGKNTLPGKVISTLGPATAGGTTTYEITSEPDIRVIESDSEPARYQRRVDGEWQTTGVQADPVIEDGRVVGFEALSPEDAASLKSTGGIPIEPQVKPTIEGYPPDNPPDTSRLIFPDHQGKSVNNTSSFPTEGPGTMASPGFNQGSDVQDVVGSSVMYNQSGVGDHKSSKNIIPWSAGTVSKAAKALSDGAKEVTVNSKSQAEELFLGLYQDKGFKNSTGFDGVATKQYFGSKKGTYHWDDVLDDNGRVIGHGPGFHGDMKHLQIHDETGQIIRIFFD